MDYFHRSYTRSWPLFVCSLRVYRDAGNKDVRECLLLCFYLLIYVRYILGKLWWWCWTQWKKIHAERGRKWWRSSESEWARERMEPLFHTITTGPKRTYAYVVQRTYTHSWNVRRHRCSQTSNAPEKWRDRNATTTSTVDGDFNLAAYIAQIGIYHVNTYINAHCFILILYEPWHGTTYAAAAASYFGNINAINYNCPKSQ